MDNKIKEHFKNHNKSEVFQTSDGFLFHKDFDAKAHAGSLKDKTVTRFERSGVELKKDEPETGVQASTGTGKEEVKATKTPTKAKTPAADKKAGGKGAKGAKAPKVESENNTNPDATGEGVGTESK